MKESEKEMEVFDAFEAFKNAGILILIGLIIAFFVLLYAVLIGQGLAWEGKEANPAFKLFAYILFWPSSFELNPGIKKVLSALWFFGTPVLIGILQEWERVRHINKRKSNQAR